MGTRSTTVIKDDGKEICRIYRQMDGYPSGHGLELAKLCDVQIINGIGAGAKAGTHANGMGCLAAQIVAGLKDGIGSIYLEPTGGAFSEWVDYIYIVEGKEGTKPTIEVKSGKKKLFKCTADQFEAAAQAHENAEA